MITVEFKNLEEMMDFAGELLGIKDSGDAVQDRAVSAPVPDEPVKGIEEEMPEPAADAEVPFKETKPEPEKPETMSYKMEDVRAKLAELNKAGKRDAVKKLLGECGATKLSELPEDKYAWIMEKAGEL